MIVPTRTVNREFRLGLGHPVLEFVATLAGRRREPLERLATPDDLSHWLDAAHLAACAQCDHEALGSARELREALYRIVTAAREQQPPTADDVRVANEDDVRLVNEWARQPAPSPQLDHTLHVTSASPDPCRAALAQLARAAIELVAGPDLQRIRNCADPSCSLMFIDRSRPGRRRWCSMERCGNRDKTARYRQRRLST
jgi:predicted RNA-binding Zn ribbon-like protein